MYKSKWTNWRIVCKIIYLWYTLHHPVEKSHSCTSWRAFDVGMVAEVAEVAAPLAPVYSWCSLHFTSMSLIINYSLVIIPNLYHSRSESNHDHIISVIKRIASSINDTILESNNIKNFRTEKCSEQRLIKC